MKFLIPITPIFLRYLVPLNTKYKYIFFNFSVFLCKFNIFENFSEKILSQELCEINLKRPLTKIIFESVLILFSSGVPADKDML